jgi:peroxiredoxin
MNRLGLVLLAIVAVAGSVSAAYRLTSDNGAEPPSMAPAVTPMTATTALPAKTRNAWELPAFSLMGLDGKQHSLEEWKGQVILLNFWASLCAPCQYEIKDFVRYQESYGGRGLQIVGIGVDEERRLRNVNRTLGINYPVLVLDQANDGKILADWGNEQGLIPYTVVIGGDGQISYIHRGQIDDKAFNRFVLPLLKPAA